MSVVDFLVKLRDAHQQVVDAVNEYLATLEPTDIQPAAKAEDAKKLFPQELADQLIFEEKDEWIIIKPRQYLGTENFTKIASIIKQNDGEYVSAGKESHFHLPKQVRKKP
jgi:hypothetical protein